MGPLLSPHQRGTHVSVHRCRPTQHCAQLAVEHQQTNHLCMKSLLVFYSRVTSRTMGHSGWIQRRLGRSCNSFRASTSFRFVWFVFCIYSCIYFNATRIYTMPAMRTTTLFTYHSVHPLYAVFINLASQLHHQHIPLTSLAGSYLLCILLCKLLCILSSPSATPYIPQGLPHRTASSTTPVSLDINQGILDHLHCFPAFRYPADIGYRT